MRILFDPFLDENPTADITSGDVGATEYVLVPHGEHDRLGESITI